MAENILINGRIDTTGKTWDEHLSEKKSYTLFLDELERKLWINGKEYNFPNQDFAFNFLCYLASNPIGAMLQFEDIYRVVWIRPESHRFDSSIDLIKERIQVLIRDEIDQLFSDREEREKYFQVIRGAGIQSTEKMSMIIRNKTKL